PNATFTTPADTSLYTNRSTTTTQSIAFNVDDTDSTGLNLPANNSINVTITIGYRNANGSFIGGSQYGLLSFFNSTTTNLTCTTTDTLSLQNTTRITCNTSIALTSNGTYLINISGRDTSNNSNAMNLTTNIIFVTIDQIPPLFAYYNFTNASSVNMTESTALQLGTSAGASRAQGPNSSVIYAISNWTDNLTSPFRGLLQFYNETPTDTASRWQTLNQSDIAYPAFNTSNWLNFSFPIPTGHNEFEGKNVSFRIVANDTVGNVNTSNQVKNFTILINDTTKPTLLVTIVDGQGAVNNSNITDATPTVVWNVTEPNKFKYIAVQINSLTDPNCNGFRNFTTTVESNRNNTLTLLDTGGCTGLGNGTNTVRLTAEDTWSNSELYIHSFTMQSGVTPVISLTGLSLDPLNFSAVNTTNVTSSTGINFSATVASTTTLKNLSFTSNCNSTGGTFAANSTIRPFQDSCVGTSANRTITVTASDFAGNTVANTLQFLVDDVAPSLAVQLPTQGSSVANNVPLNVTVQDSSLSISFVGYYLDDFGVTQLNFTAGGAGHGNAAINTSYNRSINFTPGTHRIKFTANDTLGNTVNSSVITFTVTGPVVFLEVNRSIESYIATVFNNNMTNVSTRILTDVGYIDLNTTNETAGNTFELLFQINGSINVSLTELNGSAANWNKINFTPYVNQTSFVPGLQNNFTNTILSSVWFNNSLEEFITLNNSYYGVVVFSLNISGNTATAQEFWWVENEGTLNSKTNISQCTSAFTRATTTPCWNYTANGKTIIQVPHFSIVVAVNDSIPPTAVINTPASPQYVSSFAPNVTVSTDAINCSYLIDVTNVSETAMTKTGTECIGSSITSLTNGSEHNITVRAYDARGNKNETSLLFTISDLTLHTAAISDSSGSTTGTTVSLTANESVNMSLRYGAAVSSACTTMASTATPETDFSKSQSIAISLSTVTSDTVICYNVTSCDKAGNCLTNGSFNFTQSATAAAAAAAAASSSSSGGGGGAVVSNVVASAGRQWDKLAAGSSGVLAINNANIAVTGVVVEVKNEVTSPSIDVESLSANPLSSVAASKIYQYLNIKRNNIADSDTSKITVSFKVPKSWLSTSGVAEDNVALYRYSDSKWNVLPTTKTGADANNAIYESVTPGLSVFAIGVKEAAAAPAAPEEAPAPTPEAPAAPEEAPAPTPEAPAAPEAMAAKEKISRTAMAWIVVALIVIVAAAGYFLWQKKKAQ
ncbi:PGF-pre-PGF domain-containing protein, partial [Candidatus Woesearchaeota archaeon]|nr:PGF-pre-PGF domain-containing protein [Candidatus Woesearchaeota archaeon]